MDPFSNMTSVNDNDDLNYSPAPGNILEYALHVLQCLIGLLGAIGNALVCVIVWKVRRERNYTNSLIVSQAVIDLVTSLILIANIISLAIPAPVPANYGLAMLYCIFWNTRVILFSCWAISTFNLTGIAIERYLAVIHPIWYHQHFTRRTAWILAMTAWLIAPIMQTVIGIRTSILEDGRCDTYNSSSELVVLGVLIFLWDYFIPVCIMAFAFVRIAIRLNQLHLLRRRKEDANMEMTSATASGLSPDDMKEQIMKRKNVTKTLLAVFVLYVVCWTPEQILFLQFNLGGHLEFGGALHTIALILATSNSAVNPFVYALRFKQYQHGLKSLFKRMKSVRHGGNKR